MGGIAAEGQTEAVPRSQDIPHDRKGVAFDLFEKKGRAVFLSALSQDGRDVELRIHRCRDTKEVPGVFQTVEKRLQPEI